jgi:hypothetical protein
MLGVRVQVQGAEFTIENTRMKKTPIDSKPFSGSGFGGPEFKSFIEGKTPALNGKDKTLAGWLLKNRQSLEKAGVFVHLELDAKGNPTGSYSLQNKKMLPKTVSALAQKTLGGLVGNAKKTLADAKAILLKARGLKTSNPDEAKKLAKQGLMKLAHARFLQNTISGFLHLSRVLYAQKSPAKRLPSDYKGLLKKVDGILSSAKTPDEKVLALRKSSFILDLANTKILLTRLGRSAILKSATLKKIDGFLNSAKTLFGQNAPESFERAQFILTTAKRFISVSLERRAARLDNLEARYIDFYDNVEKNPLFRAGGVFDPKKFEKLTGVPYADFKTKSGRLLPGFAKVISHYSRKSVAHYDISLKHLERAMAMASSGQKPQMSKITAILSVALRQQIVGRKQHAQLFQIKPLLAASAEIYRMMGKMPSIRKTELDTSSWRLGEKGRNDLISARKTVQANYATTIAYIYRASLCLLASQKTKGNEKEANLKQAKALLARAQAANTILQRNAGRFYRDYTYTKAFATSVQGIATKAWDDTAQGEPVVGAMADYLGRLAGNPKNRPRFNALVRRYFIKMMTNPNLLATTKWPRGREIRKYINDYMGWDVFRTFYDENATPAQVKRAATKLLDMKVDAEKSVIGNDRSGQISNKITVKVKLRDHLRTLYGATSLYKRLTDMEKGKGPLTLDKRRELLLDFMKKIDNKTVVRAMKRVIEGIDNSLKTHVRTLFLKHIKSLKAYLVQIKSAGKRIQVNGTYILKNLRPKDIDFESRVGVGTRVRLTNPTVAKAYRQLEKDAAFVAPVVGNMSEFLNDMDKSLSAATRNLVTNVARFEANRQKYVELQERKNELITGGAIIGLLIAMPFTAGKSGLVAFGVIATGATIGATVPSVYMAYKEYDMKKKDPNVKQSEKNKAYNNFLYECVMAGLVAVPVIGSAGRAFAASRGALTWARAAAGLEAVGVASGWLGVKQVYDGTTMICEGKIVWGAFNIAFGSLGIAGGVLGPLGVMSSETLQAQGTFSRRPSRSKAPASGARAETHNNDAETASDGAGPTRD